MRRIVLALVTLIASFGSFASETAQPRVGPRPVAVWLITSSWSMVIDAETPWFALYDDGQAIFVEQASAGQYTHMATRLTPSEMADVKAKLLAFIAEPVPKKIDLAPGVTDQPVSHFYLDVDGHKAATSIYGLGTRAGAVRRRTAGQQRVADVLPANLEGLHRYLSQFHQAQAKKWVPDQLEVMLWDYSYAPEASIPWPRNWPGLDDPTTLRRGDAYSVFLPGTQEEALIAFLASRKEKGAVELGGRKWAAAYRPVFPRWADAFRDQQQTP